MPIAEKAEEKETRSGRWDRHAPWVAGVLIALLLGTMALWHWEQGWQELESKIPDQRVGTRAPVKVPTQVMQRLLIHKVEAASPGLREPATVVLDTVIASDGSVVSMKRVKGPANLEAAAMDAARWWRFEPYRVDGQAVDVEVELPVVF
jgi:TonB family protein